MTSATFHHATPQPETWLATCPMCGTSVAVEMQEANDGRTYRSGDQYGDPFVSCACGAVIEPRDVVVDPVVDGGGA